MIEVTHLGKTYRRGDGTPVAALKDISFLIDTGEFVTIRGPSGSGKSSMLNIVGCLDKPSAGTYRLNGEELSGYSDKQLSHVRAWKIGFVFQSFNLDAANDRSGKRGDSDDLWSGARGPDEGDGGAGARGAWGTSASLRDGTFRR